MKKSGIALALFILIYISISVHALGVAQEYLQDNTLYLAPGASRLFKITLQNENNEDIQVQFILNSDIATIVNKKELYTIPAKFYDTYLYLNISIPKDAAINTKYSIGYYVQPLVNSSGAMIPINLRINKQLFVNVIDENTKPEQLSQQQPPTPPAEAVEEKKQEVKVEQPLVIKKGKITSDGYFKAALILAIIVFIILFFWKKSSILSKKLVQRNNKYKINYKKD